MPSHIRRRRPSSDGTRITVTGSNNGGAASFTNVAAEAAKHFTVMRVQ
jgi:hypothetical protein